MGHVVDKLQPNRSVSRTPRYYSIYMKQTLRKATTIHLELINQK